MYQFSKTAVYIQLTYNGKMTSKTAKIMNGDITLAKQNRTWVQANASMPIK